MTRPDFLTADGPLWFPGLAGELVARFNALLPGHTELGHGYGTYRWLTQNSQAARLVPASFCLGEHSIPIEVLPASVTQHFPGLTFTEVTPTNREQLEESARLLGLVDGLHDTLGQLVHAVHILSAPPGHDVSHSSPELPFSIFVSIPSPDDADSSIRLAESILHEAMHLQLTLIDLETSIGDDCQTGVYSPWKDEVRPISGLLHGIYVFAVIHQILSRVEEADGNFALYCQKRQATIKNEVAILPDQLLGLSDSGTVLWQRCRTTVLVGDQLR